MYSLPVLVTCTFIIFPPSILGFKSAPFPLFTKISGFLLDEKKMQLCDKYLLGKKNFSSFRSSGCQSHSSTRKIKNVKVFRKDDYIYIDIKADSFLYNMVRNSVGSLCLVGEGKKSRYWFNDLVKKENRIYGGKKFPASGLHLVEIRYPKRFNIDIRRKLPTF